MSEERFDKLDGELNQHQIQLDGIDARLREINRDLILLSSYEHRLESGQTRLKVGQDDLRRQLQEIHRDVRLLLDRTSEHRQPTH